MNTSESVGTVVCPGCESSQEVPLADPSIDPLVVACRHCQANLILVVPHGNPGTSPTYQTHPTDERRARLRTSTAPRSARIAVGVLCALSYLGAGILLYGASYGIRQLPPYRVAESFAKQHPELIEVLGEPIEFGWFPTAQVHRQGRKAEAYVELRVSGPRGPGEVALILSEEHRNWRILQAQYQFGQDEARPLWIQFPGDFALQERLETIMSDLDEATNARDVDGMMKHIAPDATFVFILEMPSNRQVRTFRNREEYRRDVLTSVVMVKHLRWTRQESEFHLAPDGRTATGTFLWTHEVLTQGKPVTFSIHQTITYSFRGDRPLITAVEGVQQLAGHTR